MRKQRNIVDYFPHDARASEGDTLTILESHFGNDGYAFWFKLLERLAHTENHYIDCSDSIKWQLTCAKAHITPEKAITIVDMLAELQAINPELWGQKIIWSQNLVENVAGVYKNRRREIPKKPISTTANTITTESNAISTAQSTQSRVKERAVVKLQQNKVDMQPKKPYGSFQNVLLSDDELAKLRERFDSSLQERIESLSVGIASKGYKYKSHYAAILSWARLDEKRAKDGIAGQKSNDIRDSMKVL